jgi:hypothetical protein
MFDLDRLCQIVAGAQPHRLKRGGYRAIRCEHDDLNLRMLNEKQAYGIKTGFVSVLEIDERRVG